MLMYRRAVMRKIDFLVTNTCRRKLLRLLGFLLIMIGTGILVFYSHMYIKLLLTTSHNMRKSQLLEIFNNISQSLLQQEINCDAIIDGNKTEIKRALNLSGHSESGQVTLPFDWLPDDVISAFSCNEIRNRLLLSSKSPYNLSIAFSIAIYKDFYQVEKLLRAIYRPHHVYCLHVDAKSSQSFHKAAEYFSICLPNVYLPKRQVSVVWPTFSVLESDLICAELLLQNNISWKYLINLTGQEFPLRTNNELEAILQKLNGSNNVERVERPQYEEDVNFTQSIPELRGLKFYKGSVHVLLSRSFVEYMILHPLSKSILHYLQTTDRLQVQRHIFADETFYATLNNNPKVLKVPGGYFGHWPTDNLHHWYYPRHKNWLSNSLFSYPCLSRRIVRNLCIWGAADLPAINKRHEFFINKLQYNQDQFALQCLEYRLWKNTLAELTNEVDKTYIVPLSFYDSSLIQ